MGSTRQKQIFLARETQQRVSNIVGRDRTTGKKYMEKQVLSMYTYK